MQRRRLAATAAKSRRRACALKMLSVLLNTITKFAILFAGIAWMPAPGSLGWDIGATSGVFFSRYQWPQFAGQEYRAGDANQVLGAGFLFSALPGVWCSGTSDCACSSCLRK